MKNLMRVFIVTVLAADLFAIVYFTGHYVNTGHFLPAQHGNETNPVLAALTPETAEASDSDASGVEAKDVDMSVVLAAGDPTLGQKISNKCKACHTFDSGGPNKTGPNLWNIVGGPIAHLDSFSYSSALAKRHEAGDTWTEENLYHFLENPKDFAPGTKMVLKIRKSEERAHLIAYLKTLK